MSKNQLLGLIVALIVCMHFYPSQTATAQGGIKVIAPKPQYATPGATVLYSFQIKNMQTFTDTFGWWASTNRIEEGWVVSPQNGFTNALLPGESYVVDLRHSVPADAKVGNNANITFYVYSVTNTNVNATSWVETFVKLVAGVDVISPGGGYASPGDEVTYNFRIINKGNGWDEFKLKATSQHHWSLSYKTTTGLLASGAEGIVAVAVKIPPLNLTTMDEDGTYAGATDTLNLIATSLSDGTSAANKTYTTVTEVYDVALSITPPVAEVESVLEADIERQSARFMITVLNLCNLKDAVSGRSCIELSITRIPKGWSANLGRDNVTLAGGESTNVLLFVTAPINEKDGSTKYTVTVDAFSKPLNGAMGKRRSIDALTMVKLRAGVIVHSPPNKDVEVTEYVEHNFTVENIGNGMDLYFLVATSSNGWKVSCPQSVTVQMNEESVVVVTLYIPNNVQPGTVDTLTLTAISSTDRTKYDFGSVNTTILFLHRVAVEALTTEKYIPPGKRVVFEIEVTNKGSNYDTVYLSYSPQPPPGWTAQLAETSLARLQTGEKKTVQFEVRAADNAELFQTAYFDITGTAGKASSKTTVVVKIGMLFINKGGVYLRKISMDAIAGQEMSVLVEVVNTAFLQQVGVDTINLNRTPPPFGWTVGFFDAFTGSVKEGYSVQLEGLESRIVEFRIKVSSNATEHTTAYFLVTCRSANPYWYAKSDAIVVQINVVALDLLVANVALPDAIFENEKINITVTVAAGTGGVGVTKDALNVFVKIDFYDGAKLMHTQRTDLFTLSKGSSRDITIVWSVPKLEWYDRAHIYTINVSATCDGETATTANNYRAIELVVQDKTFPFEINIILAIIVASLLVVVLVFLRGLPQRRIKYLTHLLIPILTSILLASLFVISLPLYAPHLNLYGYSICIAAFLVVFPIIPLIAYTATRSYLICIIVGVVQVPVFFAGVAAAAGTPNYFVELMLSSYANVPYLLVMILYGVVAFLFGFSITKLWHYAEREIAKTEAMIANIKKMY